MKTTTPETVGLSASRLKRLSQLMQTYIDQNKLSGIVSLIARRGEVAHFEPFGYRELATRSPMQRDTIFRIYSMTKPITTVAALMLYEQGAFQLTDPVADFIPAFKDVKVFAGPDVVGHKLVPLHREMTIHDLMTHTAGLSYGFYEDIPVDQMYREINFRSPQGSVGEAIDSLVKLPLVYQPGTAWRYSVATDVLGHLVERVSGQSLDQFFEARIFKPLGMVDTAFYVPEDKHDRLAEVYEPDGQGGIQLLDNHEVNRFKQARPHLSGGGGLTGTAADYLRFCHMLLNQGELDGERLLGRKTVELMTMNHLPDSFRPLAIGANPLPGYGFGLGVRVLVDVAASQALGSVGEYGWAGMAATFFFIDPAEALVGILMTQFIPSRQYPVRSQFKGLTYQAIID